MDVVWFVLDALSFESTPFAPNGPATMPKLESLARERGVVFTRAYAPGTASPSSHASLFTGERPSMAGMHEASPYFESEIPTIGDVLGTASDSLLISYNPFVFNGLDRGFTETDDLRGQQYVVFPEATDPRKFLVEHRDKPVANRYVRYLLDDGKPVRSLINGLSFKYWDWRADGGRPTQLEGVEARHQYAPQVNERIDDFRSRTGGDLFIVANYMDIHPPLDASDDALDKFCPDRAREDLPIDVSSGEVRDRIKAGDEIISDDMESLYRATIWDTDRRVTPLIKEFVDNGSFVAVTADHGSRFTPHHSLDDRRIHVPLLLFAPDEAARTVEKTVNIQSLPTTTMLKVAPEENPFGGTDLFSVESDQVSVSEYIHGTNPTGNDISAFGDFDDVAYDVTAIKGNSRVTWIDGEESTSGAGTHSEELRAVIADLREQGLDSRCQEVVSYGQDTQDRLEELGYL